jgi:hypothetical protein
LCPRRVPVVDAQHVENHQRHRDLGAAVERAASVALRLKLLGLARGARRWFAALAILASMGEIDPLGSRRHGLDAFLDQKVEEGYVIETRSDTHAIIFRRPKGLKRFTSGPDPGRYVVQVDEDGIATMRPAEPRRR